MTQLDFPKRVNYCNLQEKARTAWLQKSTIGQNILDNKQHVAATQLNATALKFLLFLLFDLAGTFAQATPAGITIYD